MLAPDIADAVRFGLDARLLDQAHDLDPAALDAWLNARPDDQYAPRLKVHAFVLSTRNTITERTAQ